MIKKIKAGWFVPLAFAAGTAFGDDATIRRFKAEYPAASQKLQTFYSNLRMSGTESRENVSTRWEFCGNGESLRTVVGSKSGASYVSVANAKLSFDLKKPADSSRYSVTTMGSATEKELDSLAHTIRKKAYPAAVSYAILTDPISGFIAEKSFRIGDAREVDGPGGKVIRVDWENSPQGGPNGKAHLISLPMVLGRYVLTIFTLRKERIRKTANLRNLDVMESLNTKACRMACRLFVVYERGIAGRGALHQRHIWRWKSSRSVPCHKGSSSLVHSVFLFRRRPTLRLSLIICWRWRHSRQFWFW